MIDTQATPYYENDKKVADMMLSNLDKQMTLLESEGLGGYEYDYTNGVVYLLMKEIQSLRQQLNSRG